MERLTTNKEVSEMNMIELAHNSCYGKDGKARYRDYETDIDARELAIKLLEEHADIPNEFTCDDDFDDFIADSLQYGTDDMLGLIAVFYRNLWAMANLRGRLKEYEDLEEQGHLINDIYSDASKFTEEETKFAKQILSEVQTQIDSLPTAYDLNRVKKKLEEESEKSVLVTLKAAFKVAIELIEEESRE